MKWFRSQGSKESESPKLSEAVSDTGAVPDAAGQPVAGDRGVPSMNRTRSVQSRVSSAFAIVLIVSLGFGLLIWYYARALHRQHEAQHAAEASVRNNAQGDGTVQKFPFGQASPYRDSAARAADPPPQSTASENFFGAAPEEPSTGPAPTPIGVMPAAEGVGAVRPKSPRELALERRLAGPAFARASREDVGGAGPSAVGAQSLDLAAVAASRTQAGIPEESGESGRGLNALLRPTVTPAVAASILPTRRFLLAKGAFIDCTLETAIDSTLPGMTTCITATDTFSADGTVVLLERGTKLVGETHGQVQQGAARLFVLWTEARTPAGVVVPLNSPGTDELGRSGLPGEVNRHFWDRFGAAILMTVINGAIQGAVNSQNSNGSVVVSPSTSTDVMTEVLRSTVSIPPTITKAQGDRIQVFVARDVDFRSVYALRVANAAAQSGGTP
jgi:type IV secretion system protein VirB10